MLLSSVAENSVFKLISNSEICCSAKDDKLLFLDCTVTAVFLNAVKCFSEPMLVQAEKYTADNKSIKISGKAKIFLKKEKLKLHFLCRENKFIA